MEIKEMKIYLNKIEELSLNSISCESIIREVENFNLDKRKSIHIGYRIGYPLLKEDIPFPHKLIVEFKKIGKNFKVFYYLEFTDEYLDNVLIWKLSR